MYLTLRNTHLFLGLATFLFLVMYGLSSVQMAHSTWFHTTPRVTEMHLAIPREAAGDPQAVAEELRRDGLRGELQDVRRTDAGYRMNVVRPGTVYQIEIQSVSGQAKIRVNTSGFMGMLNRIHHVAGTWHGYWLTNIWGVFVGLVSVVLIVIGATGIYLWFMIHSERVIGAILLAINLGVCVGLLALIRMA